MTLSINGNDIGQAVEIAITVASIVMLIVGGFLVWLMVRPPKHVRKQRKSSLPAREPDVAELEQMVRMIERMEERLAVLERAVGDDGEAPRRLGDARENRFLMGEDSLETRRTK